MRMEENLKNKEENKGKGNSRKEDSEKNKGMVVCGVSKELARIFKKRQITSAMKPNNTHRTLLVHPKDKTDPKEGVYTLDCTGCQKSTREKLKES